jgi:hypothetical protein
MKTIAAGLLPVRGFDSAAQSAIGVVLKEAHIGYR